LWVDGETGTSRGTPYGYDVRVPLFLFGKGIAAGEYLDAASPTDVAPTLAFVAGITLPRSDGRVLMEAITREVRALHTSSLPLSLDGVLLGPPHNQWLRNCTPINR
jgi:hypothetical protein